MQNEAVTIESARRFMEEALAGFVNDPPDSDSQRGYLDALYVIAAEALGMDLGHTPPAIESRPKQHLRVIK